MSRRWKKKPRMSNLDEATEKMYAEKEAKIVEEVLLCTPTSYFRLGREEKGEWEDITYLAPQPENEEVTTTCLGDYENLIDRPLKMGDHELPRGAVIIVGGPVAGKTYSLEQMSLMLTAMKHKWVAFRYREPIEPNRFSRHHRKLDDLELLEQLARFMVAPNHEAEVMFLDSCSALLFRQWPTWNTGRFGLNSGLGFWLTDLHDALVKWGKTLVTPANPYATDPTVIEGFYQFCRGRAGGVVQLEATDRGTYSYRSTTGRRVEADFGQILRSMPIVPPRQQKTSTIGLKSRQDRFI